MLEFNNEKHWIVRLNEYAGFESVKMAIGSEGRISNCVLFWSTLYAGLTLLVQIMVFSVAVFMLLSPFIDMFTLLVFDTVGYSIFGDGVERGIGYWGSLVILLIEIVVTFVIAHTLHLKWFPKWLPMDRLYEAYKTKYQITKKATQEEIEHPKQPNVFVEWLKGKKEKVCPVVHFNFSKGKGNE